MFLTVVRKTEKIAKIGSVQNLEDSINKLEEYDIKINFEENSKKSFDLTST
jgi:uncharacterized protein (DUF4213/DUF364 family)